MEPPDKIVISIAEELFAAEVRGVVRRFPVEGDPNAISREFSYCGGWNRERTQEFRLKAHLS